MTALACLAALAFLVLPFPFFGCCCECVDTVCGTVTGCANEPIQDVTVTLTGPSSHSTTTDASGHYCLTAPSGTYTLTFVAPSGRFATSSGSITVPTNCVPQTINHKFAAASGFRCCDGCNEPIPEHLVITTPAGSQDFDWSAGRGGWVATDTWHVLDCVDPEAACCSGATVECDLSVDIIMFCNGGDGWRLQLTIRLGLCCGPTIDLDPTCYWDPTEHCTGVSSLVGHSGPASALSNYDTNCDIPYAFTLNVPTTWLLTYFTGSTSIPAPTGYSGDFTVSE